MSRPSLVIVLLEDDRQKMVMYRYLIKCGYRRHEVRIEQAPPGQGSAESWIRRRFVKETCLYRNRRTRARTALIVVIDADAHTVQDRVGQLDDAMRESGNQVINQGEKVARLVPRRNIETWILCLNGHEVDEETDYKGTRNAWNELVPLASENLCQWTRTQSNIPNACVDSLRIGVQELQPLLP